MVCCRCLLGLLGLPDKPFFYQSLSHHLSIIIPLLTITPGLWNPIGYCDWFIYIYIYIYVCTLCPLLKSYMFTINYPPINHLTTWKTHVGPFWHWLYHSCNWRTTESARKQLLLRKKLVTGPKIVGAKPQYVINDGSPHVPGLLFDNLEACLYRLEAGGGWRKLAG